MPRSTLYSWIRKYKDNQHADKSKAINLKNFRILETKVRRLEGIVQILKKSNCTATASVREKLAVLESLHGQYSVHMLCEALDVPRGTFYNHILRNKKNSTTYAKRREELRIKIQEVYDKSNQIFGAKKIAAVLKNGGRVVSAEMVLELMREMGLSSIRQNAKSLYLKSKQKIINHLKQNFHTDKPNPVWVSDVTYFRYKEKAFYICVIIDLFSRKVVGHRISFKNSTQLVKSTFNQAYENRKPRGKLIFHSDRGSTYYSKTFCDYLETLHVEQSFSRAYVPYDNSVAETFFSSMKREELYRTKYRSENELRKAIEEYIEFYNTKRPHAKLKYKTPGQFEANFSHNYKVSAV